MMQLVRDSLDMLWPPHTPVSWRTIHTQLMARLQEAGFTYSPQELEQLHLLGRPAQLVQVLFATGVLSPVQFAAQGAIPAWQL